MTVGFEQSARASYEHIIFRYLSRTHTPPPAGWGWAQLTLPLAAVRIDDPARQEEFMRELLKVASERCSAVDPKKTSTQGLWIEDFSGQLIMLRGGVLKVFPLAEGESANEQWIQVSP
jgi:hypothetical protein